MRAAVAGSRQPTAGGGRAGWLLPALLALAACSAPAAREPGAPAPGAAGAAPPGGATFCNPLDLDYRFMPDAPSQRSAADPVIVLFEDEYYLFATASGGYWRSPDLRAWTRVVPAGLPIEDAAPAVLVLDGRMYFTAHKSKALYASDDPRVGRWQKVAELASYADPAFFLDDDGRVYLYHGSALDGAISVVELDPRQGFRVVRGPFELMRANHAEHGWERSGPENLGAVMSEGFRIAPYVEGAWMTRHAGTYYLQYAAPGTVWKTYADGVYTSRSPVGGFAYAPYSPFSYKPGGFAGSAGHSGLFRDRAGNYWRVTTMIISVAHKFERRLGIFPAGFDADGVLRTDTYLGDYPQYLPGVVRRPLAGNRTGWMLLSGGQRASASSTLDTLRPELAFDEEIRTWWSARSGEPGEWLAVDLGAVASVYALQLNFAEQDARAFGRDTTTYHQYLVEASRDGRTWWPLVDRRASRTDAPHAYLPLDRPVRARHLRVTNRHVSGGGRFALRDLRVFGRGEVALPAAVASLAVQCGEDPRGATLRWSRAARARGYVVRFGLAPDQLHASYQVGDVTTLALNSLNRGVTYYFTVDAFNERGVTRGRVVRAAEAGPGTGPSHPPQQEGVTP